MPPSHQQRRNLPPFFTPVKLRARRDGWTGQVQCAFLAELYLIGAVSVAAVRVGRSRATAYALRERSDAEGFAAAWDFVLRGPARPDEPPVRYCRVADWRKLTLKQLIWMNETGLWRPVIYRGKMRSIARKPDNSALLRLLRRTDPAPKSVAGAAR
ncbi:hypothetical protein [Erythrobacter rubeus]|uniref:Helix-turn-helix domain-containing protein n=1 Tax=Erythrobacter rubeus TaxID=2760803 RepID=A0ABR8KT79_9SPHN|nr:hypothetical protein [Erythrobacter rubeus]MBD2842805.1 hypothetical protein [Erythrobacter rubeus]